MQEGWGGGGQGFLEVFPFFLGGGGRVYLVEHSVEDHYLHKNWIIFWGE